MRFSAYARIAESLRNRILGAKWRPGGQLPTESELCVLFGASRITIRRALQILEQELLIQRRQGSGTFVSVTTTRKIPIFNADFFGSVAQHAPKLIRRLCRSKWTTASEEIAAELGLTPGEPVLAAQRIDSIGAQPVAADEAFLVGRFARNLGKRDLSELDFLRRWQEVESIQLKHCTQAVEAIPASTRLMRRLQVKRGTPLLKEIDVVFIRSGQAAGLFISFYRHEHFRLTSTVKLPITKPDRNGTPS